MARVGQAQLAVWISVECMARLKSLAAQSGDPIRVVIEQALAAYKPGAIDAPVDRLTSMEARIAALESRQGTSSLASLDLDIAAVDLDIAADEVSSIELGKLDKLETDEVAGLISTLAAQGLTPSGIAAELNRRGFLTANGARFQRGNSRIMRAVKTAKEQHHD